MTETLLISFREGVEAFLIIAIVTVSIKKLEVDWLMSAIYTGIGAATAASIALGIALAQIGALSVITEAWLAIAAAIAILWCVAHMHHAGPEMAHIISTKLSDISQRGPCRAWFLVAGFTFFMIAREGVEAATMIASLSISGGAGLMITGGLLGLTLAASASLAWVKFGRRVPVAAFFRMSTIVMSLLAIQMLLYGMHEFTEAMAIPFIDNEFWHYQTEVFTEGWVGQAIFGALILVPLGWLILTYLKANRFSEQSNRAE